MEGRQLLSHLSSGGSSFPQPTLANPRVASIQLAPGSWDLVIEGTDSADEITISHPTSGGVSDTLTVVATVKDRATQAVLASLTYVRPATGIDNILVNGYDGDDRVTNSVNLRFDRVIHGGWGNDWITDTRGPNDRYYHVALHGELGNDRIEGGGSLYGGEGSDTLIGLGTRYGEINYLYGGPGFDTLTGGSEGDYLYGEGDADWLYGMGGYDELHGGPSNDFLFGGTEGDELFGDDGFDWLFGDDGHDLIDGGAQDDHLYGGAGNDDLFGRGGADRLYGELDDDELRGGTEDDWLYGGPGSDDLYGEAGFDRLYGEDGGDDLSGGYDGVADELWGGAGADRFFILYQKKVRKRDLLGAGVYLYYWEYTVVESNDQVKDRASNDYPDQTEVGIIINPYDT